MIAEKEILTEDEERSDDGDEGDIEERAAEVVVAEMGGEILEGERGR